MSDFPFGTYEKPNQAATLGLIVLKADETIELDFRKLVPIDVALHISRIESDPQVTSASLMKMKGRLTAAALLFPDMAKFDCVAYACTSGTSIIGQDEVALRVRQGCTTNSVTDPVTALIAACKHLNIQKLAILSPYVEDVSSALRNVLAKHNVSTSEFGSFNEADEARVVRIDEHSIFNAATQLVRDADALFISCTNLRALGVIQRIENAIGKPVLTSNQVLAWHRAVSANTAINIEGFGRLLKPTFP